MAPAAILDELTTLGLSMARDLHARQAQAETAAEAAQLAEAFHKISRSVRQSLALKARLARIERQDRLPAARDAQELRILTRARVREGCARLIWTEAEGDEAEDLEHRLDTALDTADLAPVADQIAAIARTLGLKTPPEAADPSPGRPVHKDGAPEKVIFEWVIVDPAQKEPNPPPQGEVAAQPTEEVEAPQPRKRIPRGLPGEYPPWDAWIDDG